MCWTTCALAVDLNYRNLQDDFDAAPGTWHLNQGLESERPSTSLASHDAIVDGVVVGSRTPHASRVDQPQGLALCLALLLPQSALSILIIVMYFFQTFLKTLLTQ